MTAFLVNLFSKPNHLQEKLFKCSKDIEAKRLGSTKYFFE